MNHMRVTRPEGLRPRILTGITEGIEPAFKPRWYRQFKLSDEDGRILEEFAELYNLVESWRSDRVGEHG